MKQTLLIGIGAQKAGTTWLSDYLREHQPRVHQTPMKEVHFFDNYLMPQYGSYFEEQRLAAFKRSVTSMSVASIGDPGNTEALITHLHRFRAVRSPALYLDFMRRNSGQSDILCDITPDYALLDASGFKLMREMHDDVKLIFLLRNPADRFWSSLRFNQTHNPAFDIEANFDPFLHRQDFVRFADYGRTIRAVLEYFEPQHLYIEFYENLFSDNAIRKFCEWLNLDFVPGQYDVRSNSANADSLSEAKRNRLVQAYEKTYRECLERFPDVLPESWRQDISTYL